MPFDPLTQVTALHAGWASDPLGSWPADGGAVATWRNQSGGGDPTQATGAQRPTYRASTTAFGNRPTVQFDGGDILTVDIVDIAQPFKFLIVGSLTGAGTQVLFGLNNANTGAGRTATAWYMNAVSTVTGGTADANPHSFLGIFNGASSSMGVDGAVGTVAGNTNTAGMNVLFIGAGTGLVTPLTGHLAFWGFYSNATSNADLAKLASDFRYFYEIDKVRPTNPALWTGQAVMRASVY